MNFILILSAILLITWFIGGPFRGFRDQKVGELWNEMVKKADDSSSLLIGKVNSIRQYARTGTKAYVSWIKGEAANAVWIRDVRLNPGEYLLVDGSEGHGDHHNETVFYIKNLYMRLPLDAEKCWERYKNRLEKGIGKYTEDQGSGTGENNL